jgi:hypothetical protein
MFILSDWRWIIRGVRNAAGWCCLSLAGATAAVGQTATGNLTAQSVATSVMPEGSAAAPFTAAGPDGEAAVSAEWAASAGRDALRAGLPYLAQGLFTQALATPGLEVAERDALNLDLATAWLALDQTGNATQALNAVGAKDSAAYALRSALLAARSEHWPDAAAQLARVNPAGLPAADRPWYYVVQGLLAEQAKDTAGAQAAWQQAGDAATTPLQRAQFEAAEWRGQMMMTDQATPELAALLQQQAKEYENQSAGVQFAKEYAIVLDKLGQHDAAVAVVTQLLTQLLNGAPVEDPDSTDSVRLLLALLDPKSTRAQAELKNVLQERRAQPTQEELLTQEIALTLLEQNSEQVDPAGLQKILDDLIHSQPRHPLQDQLYLLQARLALSQGQLAAASDSAQRLLDEYAGSPAHQEAWRLLADIAWQSKPPRYRDAADYLHRLWVEMPDGPERPHLAMLLADSYFLSGDYPEAAAAYTTLLGTANPPAPRGDLLLRAVQSEILASRQDPTRIDQARLDAALQLVEDAAGQGIAPLDRWQAEWNVLTALRDAGRTADAFKHLDPLLGAGKTALPPELQVRLSWLAARLAVDVSDASAPARTQALADELNGLPADGVPGVDKGLLDQLKAQALLMQGQAAYYQNQMDAYQSHFKTLRDSYPDSAEAIYSIFFEARALAAAGQTADAEGLMNGLADKYKDSPYAPLALYESALYAEARGQAKDALDRLGLFVERDQDQKYAAVYDPLMYQVLLLQGDLERKDGNFSAALAVYNVLLHDYPESSPDRPRAEMDQADCLVELSGENPSQRDAAQSALERLLNLPSLPVDARVEAGFKLGSMLARDENADDAAQVYYSVVRHFLDDGALASELGPQGRYWMSKCLFELADLYEQKNQFETAKQLYNQVLEHNLPGQALANARLTKPPTSVPAAPGA